MNESSVPNPPIDPHRHVVFRGARAVVGEGTSGHIAASRAPTPPSTEPQQTLDPQLAKFYKRLFARASLESEHYRESVLQRRAGACVRAVGSRDLATAEWTIERDAAAAERGLQAVAIGVTSFFRDPQVFDALVPTILTLAEQRENGLRILSVGCSDGRELYSMALLLDSLSVNAAALHGVDCRATALRAAASGRYLASQVEEVPHAMRMKSFVSTPASNPAEVQLQQKFRDRCSWRVADAFTLTAPIPYDIVLCRNLLIYLLPDPARELWSRLMSLVATDGVIVAGKAERPPASEALHRLSSCIFQRRREGL